MADQDATLVRWALQGDVDAFAEIVKRYESAVVNYIYWIVLNRDDALDIAQVVFFKVYQSLDKYNPEYKFSSWLFTVAKNCAIDTIRRNPKNLVSLDEVLGEEDSGICIQVEDYESPSPEKSFLNKELGMQMNVAMNELPIAYREVIVLRHLQDKSYEEMSEILDLPLGTIKNRLFRAREILKEILSR
jgi:RNA polymerase sigma-70 factor, ECF subfamily